MIRTVFCLLFIIVSIIYGLKQLVVLQQNNYYFAINRNKKSIQKESYEIFVLSAMGGLAVIASAFLEILGYVLTTITLAGSSAYFLREYYNLRTKYNFTPRATRLFMLFFITTCVLHSAASIFITTLYLRLFLLFMLLIMSRFVASGVNSLVRPIEHLNNKRYIDKVKQQLATMDIIKIGITGSFGKTSCKNILASMLEKKYKVVKTIGNYNTPMGIVLSAKELEKDTEVFIAEMGAKRKGDIKELTDMVQPRYAIITGVAPQHLASFKVEENIFSTKKELIDGLPFDGYAVFNGDNLGSSKMSKLSKCEYSMVHLDKKSGIYADKIKLTNAGSSFEICGMGEPISVSTQLLGRHNILNILMCAVLAFKLGVSKVDIVNAITELKPLPHRLELVKNARNITIIDDSYNANIEGANFALEVVKQFDGRKVIFSQGIIELGDKQETINESLGILISQVADIVILTGINADAIEKGLNKGGFGGQVYRYKSLLEAQSAFPTVLNVGDVLLIQNDIP